MKYGFIFFNGGAREAADFAYEAEQEGWDGFFVPDGIWSVDPWVMLTAAAMRTERIKLGTMITPISRRRPWDLASQTTTLDNLSNGRVILSVGLGALDTGFAAFGEATDRKIRAELMDEGLDIVTGLWKGQPFSYNGKHYHISSTSFFPPPPPVQQPRIPIWVVGAWPREKSMARVAKYDGLLPNKLDESGNIVPYDGNDLRAMREYVEARRKLSTPFDVVVESMTPGDDRAKAADIVRPFAEGGATWYLEGMWGAEDTTLNSLRKRIRQGPPRID
jgi:alkanesulfonate monooxygenase SsuD/methylene tetrahydromethanopterin reductase-like flavin-dependent oxidoreductase (luciferase family)